MNNPESPVIEPVSTPSAIQAIWKINLQPVGCSLCKQVFLVDPAFANQVCPNCASTKLEPQPALLRNEPPELVIPFAKKRVDLAPIFSQFVKGIWLHNDDFNPQALLAKAVPVFWPKWLVDSHLIGHWQAEIGFDYQVKSSKESYKQGNWQTTEVVETRIRWEKRLGELDRQYNNIAVPAFTDEKNRSGLTGDYQLMNSVSYDSGLLNQVWIQVPDLHPEQAWPFARHNLDLVSANECMRASAGQHIRNASIQVNYQNINWSQLLLPLWITHYHGDDGKPQMVLINGQTGNIGGRRLASQRKGWLWAGSLVGVAIGLFILGLICAGLGTMFPPLAIIATIFIILAFAVGGCAVVPAIWPWQWNRKYK